jgi:hypothetical protein
VTKTGGRSWPDDPWCILAATQGAELGAHPALIGTVEGPRVDVQTGLEVTPHLFMLSGEPLTRIY